MGCNFVDDSCLYMRDKGVVYTFVYIVISVV